MGTCYYFYRRDNETLFDMDKAYGLIEWLELDKEGDVLTGDLEASLAGWLVERYGSRPEEIPDEVKLAKALAAAVRKFQDGKPIRFVSEYAPEIDELYDKFPSALDRITHDRFSKEPDYGRRPDHHDEEKAAPPLVARSSRVAPLEALAQDADPGDAVSDELPQNVDAAHYRATLAREADAYPEAYQRFEITLTLGELETLLEAYERMIGDKCRACGSDTRKRYCCCENDE